MASAAGRGAQVRLSGAAQTAARGKASTTPEGNTAAKVALELAGIVADGTTVDGSTSTGVAAIDDVVIPGKAALGAYALTDGANIATDASYGNFFTVTLAGNRTLDNPTNLIAGVQYTWRITQDATGSRTLAFGTAFKFAGGTDPTVTATASAVSIIQGSTDGTSVYCSSILAAA